MYRPIGMIVILMVGLITAGCGGGTGLNPGNINGTWTATLTNPDGSSAFAFTTSFTQSSGNALSVTNFTFSSSGSCFSSPTTETGSFNLSGNFNGTVTGSFEMTISTLFPEQNNVLTLNGTVNGSTISGTWTLTGTTGCSGNGTFTFNKTT